MAQHVFREVVGSVVCIRCKMLPGHPIHITFMEYMRRWHDRVGHDFDRYIESFDVCVRLEWMCDIMFGWEQSRLYHVIEAIQANAIDRVRCAYAVEYCVMRQNHVRMHFEATFYGGELGLPAQAYVDLQSDPTNDPGH